MSDTTRSRRGSFGNRRDPAGGGAGIPDVTPMARKDGRRPTMRDVAQAAGVSVMTVSRVINNEPTVHPDYIDRVLKAAVQLGFRRNNLARDLRAGRETATIGLVTEDLRNPFYSQLAREIEQVARSHDTLLITGSSEEDPAREQELIVELCHRRVDGLIVVPTASNHVFCRTEIDLGTPMVFLDRKPEGIEADTVLIDNVGGAAAGTERLIARGHRRIAVIGYEQDLYTIAERTRGFRAAMEAAGLEVDESLLRFGAFTTEQAAAEAAALLDGPNPPTGFFCCNNRMTVGVVEELDRRRAEVDIVGFDDIDFGKFLPMPVTLIGYSVEQFGRRAAEMLFRRIRGYRGRPQTSIIRTNLITRGRRASSPAPAVRAGAGEG